MQKRFTETASGEGNRLFSTKVKYKKTLSGEERYVKLTVELRPDGYVMFHKAIKHSGGASWEYSSSDADRFEKDHKGLMTKVAEELRRELGMIGKEDANG